MALRQRIAGLGRKRLIIIIVALLGSCGLCGIIANLLPESDTPERVATVVLATAVPKATSTVRPSRTPVPSRTPIPSRTATSAPTKADTLPPTITRTPKPTATIAPTPEGGGTVYITRTGTKYHELGCSHLSGGSQAVTCEWAKANNYTACGSCNPRCP